VSRESRDRRDPLHRTGLLILRPMPTQTTPVIQPAAAPNGPSGLKPVEFVRLTKEIERKEFYRSLPEPRWWTGGGRKDPERGWIEIFKQSDWRCIYCSRDLTASTDALAESTEEHLVPRSLLDPNCVSATTAHNMAACCLGCNSLKGEYVPPATHPCWKSRKAYVKACKQFIAGRRLKNFVKYRDHIEGALKERAGQ